MRSTDPRKVWDPPHRTPRERTLDRLQVMGALLIAFAVVIVAAIALL
ncbi:MAG TPA: hypothetical protein VFX80_12315 [Solirubrobacteraceae bacterium]|nr:hypothetical protein [Solirubrobacteraceae bacterium]